ncbi:hypothetical protein GCK72_012336 [Caenorhabditis remanei]|uniref:Uncharacterized protein n=1 Tax=Caenorhabditis remanei TaxID=31234 RepID=A0A6A5GMM4_CAERE|nr:hypothetical protein GCK72_012336 [Caenorhabditis remanei]KAF1755883.1 hypothetical protein GCK72_012336 [Caenorhabditis remanei]
MSAVFSAPLNGSKTRFSRPHGQAPKSQTNNSSNQLNSYPTPASGGKWKRSIDEVGMDTKPNFGASTDGSEPLAKESRVGSPKNVQVCNASEGRKRYLGEKAATIEMPTTEAAELSPKFLFDDRILVLQMCLPCRIKSRFFSCR